MAGMLKIRKAEFDEIGFYPVMRLTVDVNGARIKAVVGTEQKAIEYGFVALGDDFEVVLDPLTLPADPDNGRPMPQDIFGFTDDADVLALYRKFRAAADSGDFETGPVDLDAD
jgi:hypothetical protein